MNDAARRAATRLVRREANDITRQKTNSVRVHGLGRPHLWQRSRASVLRIQVVAFCGHAGVEV